MERCPNCGSEARNGAKFCTSCGHGILDEASAEPTAKAPSTREEPPGWNMSQRDADENDLHDGWPGAIPVTDPERGAWAPAPTDPATNDPGELAPTPTDFAGFWPESAPDPWASSTAEAINGDATDARADDFETTTPTGSTVKHNASENRARGDALDLLEQLRAAIMASVPAESIDLSGVISDLEVAVTPPGALPPEDATELREAIFAARENPRDIDTIVDLTRRLDGLAALVIAYDRAIAAIERSLDVLKDEGDGVTG